VLLPPATLSSLARAAFALASTAFVVPPVAGQGARSTGQRQRAQTVAEKQRDASTQGHGPKVSP